MATVTATASVITGNTGTWTPSGASLITALASNDGSSADGSCGKDTDIITLTGFDFSSIPSGSTINTITYEIIAKFGSSGVEIQDFTVVQNGVSVENHPINTLTTSFQTFTFNPSTVLNYSDITNSNFGTTISGTNTYSGTRHLFVDYVAITVDYTPPGASDYYLELLRRRRASFFSVMGDE